MKKTKNANALRDFEGNKILSRINRTFFSENELPEMTDYIALKWLKPNDNDSVVVIESKEQVIEKFLQDLNSFEQLILRRNKRLLKIRSMLQQKIKDAPNQESTFDLEDRINFISRKVVDTQFEHLVEVQELIDKVSRAKMILTRRKNDRYIIEFGQRLRQLRDKQNISAAQLGEMISTSGNAVTAYERATRTPTFLTIIQFAKIFDVDLNWLLLGKESR